jgi:O-antigen/teichoic acid export membrane protein
VNDKTSFKKFFAGNITSTALSFLSVIASLPVLDSLQRGQLAIASLIGTILSVALDLGTGVAASFYSRQLGSERVLGALNTLVVLKLAMLTVASGATALFLSDGLLGAQKTEIVLGILNAGFVTVSSAYLPQLLLKETEKSYLRWLIFQSGLPVAVFVTMNVLGMSTSKDALTLSAISGCIYSILLYQRVVVSKHRSLLLEKQVLRSLLEYGAGIGFSALVNLLISRAWQLILAGHLGVSTIGLLSLSQTFTEKLSLIGDALGQSFFRKSITVNYATARKEQRSQIRKGILALGTIAVGISTTSAIAAKITAGEISEVATMIAWLIAPASLLSVFRVQYHVLNAAGQTKKPMVGYVIGGMSMFMLLFPLVERLGWKAASISQFIGGIVSVAYCAKMIRREDFRREATS